MANIDSEEKNLNLEIFDKIQDEVVVFEIIRDILDKIADLRVIYANEAFLTDRDMDFEGIIGCTLTELYGEDIAENYLKIAIEVLSSGEGREYEAYFKSLDKYYLVSTFSPGYEKYITISRDITEPMKALNKSEKILENIDEIYFELDKKWQFIKANSKIESLTGQKNDELIGKNIWKEFSELKDTEYYTKFYEAKTKGKDIFFNVKFPKTGEWYRVHAYPYPNGLEVYSRNINNEINTEKELEDLEIKFKTLFDKNDNAVIISDIKTGKYVNVNRKAEELTGYSKNELLSMGTGELTSSDLKEMAINELRRLSEEDNIRIETEIQTRDKGIIPIEICTSIIETDDNIYSLGILRDISIIKKEDNEKKELDEQLKQYILELEISKEKYDSLSEELSKAKEDKNEIIQEIKQHIRKLEVSKEKLDSISEELSRANAEKKELKDEIEKRIEELISSKEKLKSTSEKLEKSDEEVRKNEEQLLKLEQELQEREAQYTSLARNLPSVLMRYDREFKVVYIAPSAEHISDVSINDFIGKTNREAGMPEEICDLWEPAIQKVFETGKTQEIEFDFPSSNNNPPKRFHLKFIPEFKDAESTVQHVLGISTEITKDEEAEMENRELKEQIKQLTGNIETSKEELESANKELQIANEEISKQEISIINLKNALHESEKESLHLLVEMEAIYNSAPIGLCTLDRELRYMRVNKKLAEINDVPAEDHIGKTIREIVPDIAEQVEDIAQFVFKNGLPVLDAEFSNDDQKTWNAQWVPLKDIDGNIVGINVAALETTELKNIERKLQGVKNNLEEKVKEQTKEYDDKYDTLLTAYSVINGIIECSDDLIAAWDTEYKFIAFNDAYKGIFKRMFGKDVELEMNIKDLLLESPEEDLAAIQLWEKALKGEKFTVEMVFDIDSKNVFYEITYYPLKDVNGNIIGASHIARDITEHQKSEERLKKQVEDLRISGDELDSFISEDSEDIQETLENILNNVQLLEEHAKDRFDENVVELREDETDTEIETVDLLEYPQVISKDDKFNSIYTNSMLDHVISTLKISPEDQDAKIIYDSLPNIRGDVGELQEVFHNLICNAIRFRKSDEPLEINISANEDEENNEYIFQVSDNGRGIKKQYGDIEIIKKIIEHHGGRTWVESTLNEGSTFFFTIKYN